MSELKPCREAFEMAYEVPDFMDFDGEDYMDYGEDPILIEEAENIHAHWNGFQAAWNTRPEQPEPGKYYKVSELRERIAQIGIAQKLPTPAIVSILGYIDDVPVYTIPEKLSAGDVVRRIRKLLEDKRAANKQSCLWLHELDKIESEIGGEG